MDKQLIRWRNKVYQAIMCLWRLSAFVAETFMRRTTAVSPIVGHDKLEAKSFT